MTFSITRFARLAAASALSAALIAGPALADGPTRRGSIKDPVEAPAPRACALSANVALATEYVFRGISQTSEGPAVQGGFDATCGMFYAGVWASNLDWGVSEAPKSRSTGMPASNQDRPHRLGCGRDLLHLSQGADIERLLHGFYPINAEFNYVELKVGASAELWKDGTLGVTGFFSPDYQYETGNVWTVEPGSRRSCRSSVSAAMVANVSALLGYQAGTDSLARYVASLWRRRPLPLLECRLTLGFLEKWSLDLRYWDSNLSDQAGVAGFCTGATLQCDERFMATLKFTY